MGGAGIRLNLMMKLLAGFLLVAVITAGLGIFALTRLSAVSDQANGLGTDRLPKAQQLGNLKADVSTYRRQLFQHILSDTPEERATYEQRLRDLENTIQTELDTYEGMTNSDEGRALVEDLRNAWASYLPQSGTWRP
ncbi:MAG TPA: MCP four helix bundle domain-containing protein [Dehalococcoidia bacterium]